MLGLLLLVNPEQEGWATYVGDNSQKNMADARARTCTHTHARAFQFSVGLAQPELDTT